MLCTDVADNCITWSILTVVRGTVVRKRKRREENRKSDGCWWMWHRHDLFPAKLVVYVCFLCFPDCLIVVLKPVCGRCAVPLVSHYIQFSVWYCTPVVTVIWNLGTLSCFYLLFAPSHIDKDTKQDSKIFPEERNFLPSILTAPYCISLIKVVRIFMPGIGDEQQLQKLILNRTISPNKRPKCE